MQKFLPLFLSGGAFSVYESCSTDVKEDYEQLRAALTNAFSLNTSAYEAFVSRRYVSGQAVDVYSSELRRLARLVCATSDDSWIKCAFVAGLPDKLKRQLKAAVSLENMTLEEVVERTRNLTNVQESCCAIGIRKERRTGAVDTCYNCQKAGHLARDCANGSSQRTAVSCCEHSKSLLQLLKAWSPGSPLCGRLATAAKQLTIRFCGEISHVMANCPVRSTEVSKNE